ncbi:acetolactate synthase large subunit [Rhodopseudomonas palustris HaA2]|uniref:Acetolactate synthase large subunit n=1 Tax=Rhodopseudomonas palustris (strain HaA2) TaxID=316058 RepID=Q2ITG4_RHOP2|nr:thiamine pyrophosphate-binding protein [Rhodopseudomonas palustris]ABD08496.1 acetolactate synthase large subunit [Rhodopseudomonas palustris HaA2]
MKLSDYVIDFLAQRGVSHVFGISGGAAVHMFDSAAKHPDVTPIFPQHEQAAAIAADGYARATGKLGVAITTSGPGATNLLTGVCCAYYDSVPTLMITGQVATHRLKGNNDVRQLGFQETDVTSIFATVTKYAVQISDPATIRYHLEKAYYLAFEGRPGAVLIDLPDDLQRAEIDPEALASFVPETQIATTDLDAEIVALLPLIAQAKRPVLVLGGGLSTPRIGAALDQLIDRLAMPVLTTWAATDLIAHDHPLRVGPFGVYGPRLGNFTVQNADLILCLGSRLSQNVTGGILPSFAREATIVMVDASRGEMDKFDARGIAVATRIEARLDGFVPKLLGAIEAAPPRDEWLAQIAHWRSALPDDRPGPAPANAGFVDAYDFVDKLSETAPADELIYVDTGGNLTWTCNGFRIQRGQRLISDWNNTAMGYALPAAIGAAVQAKGGVSCIIGDGGLMLSLGELALLSRHRLPVRLFLFNNHGHGIQKQTLETWLDGNYVGVDAPSGLSFVDVAKVAEAMDLPVVTISRSADIAAKLREVYARQGPVFCNVEINPAQKLYPVLKFGAPLESQMPAIDDALIAREMIVPPFVPGAAPKHSGGAGV